VTGIDEGILMRSGGFTLVELITTLIIVGIIAVFAIGRLDFAGVFEQRGKLDQVKAALQFARKAAVAQRRFVCVATVGNQLTLTLDTRVPEAGAAFCDGSSSVNLDLPGRDGQCAGGVNNAVCSSADALIASATAAFAFDPQGRSTAASNVAVTVTGQPGVTVEAATGYVH
jgi:MSHA pilin protein MshC